LEIAILFIPNLTKNIYSPKESRYLVIELLITLDSLWTEEINLENSSVTS
jgi:hypothetical protein